MMPDNPDILRAWLALSPMQKSVAVLVRDDLPDKLIADRLRISARTVRYHLSVLRRVFGCASKLGVAVMAERVTGLSKVTSMQSAQTVENLSP
jgi:DNA-binding CsgD family transcriptional regulator